MYTVVPIYQVRSDWYVYAVLSSLPWVGRELYEKKEMEFERLLQTIENYIKYVFTGWQDSIIKSGIFRTEPLIKS